MSSRNPDYQFVSTDTETIISELVAKYEELTDSTVRPGSPERLFIQWVANVIVQERVLNNITGNQNIPSRAEGDNLDALGDLFLVGARPEAAGATCMVRFYISEPQQTAVLIRAGTRVRDSGGALVWETLADVYVPIGESYVDTQVKCQTVGTIGNGYAVGQINTLVDIYDYYSECSNITVSDGGADRATDDEYYELMRASMDAYSDAGARGSYIYFAKKVSTEIADVVATSPVPGYVKIYVLMEDGSVASEEIKSAVLAMCSADDVRPLTDFVSVEDAKQVTYNIDFTYYTTQNSPKSGVEIAAAVQEAVDTFISWQHEKMGRDINPSHLIWLLMQTGVKRVDLREPQFTSLRDGTGTEPPQFAKLGTVTITNGGYEDE